MAELVLVLGGMRSGKSAVAERIAAGAPAVVYVATAAEADGELARRIAAHRARRPPGWRTVEGADPAAAVAAAPRGAAVLVDGTGVWLAGRMARLGLLDAPPPAGSAGTEGGGPPAFGPGAWDGEPPATPPGTGDGEPPASGSGGDWRALRAAVLGEARALVAA